MAQGRLNILNKHRDKVSIDDVYIGRGSIFGNPFTHLLLDRTQADVQVDSVEEALARYREHVKEMLRSNPEFRSALTAIVKKLVQGDDVNLVCFCKPKPCHGDYLKEIIEKAASRTKTMDQLD